MQEANKKSQNLSPLSKLVENLPSLFNGLYRKCLFAFFDVTC